MKTAIIITALLCAFLSSRLFAGEFCMVSECRRSSDANLSCRPETIPIAFFVLNGEEIDGYTTPRIPTSDSLSVDINHCVDGENHLIVGENTIRVTTRWSGIYAPGNVALSYGWLNWTNYVESDLIDRNVLCKFSLRPGNHDGEVIGCTETISITLEELDPELAQKIERLNVEVEELLENIDQYEQDRINDIIALDAVLNNIADLDFDQIISSHVDQAEYALEQWTDLKANLDELQQEIDILKDQFDESFEDISTTVDNALASEGLNPEDFAISHPLNLDLIEIPLISTDTTFDPEQDIYSTYANQVIVELSDYFNGGDNLRFIETSKAWLLTIERLRTNLDANTVPSPAEWTAFNTAFERVETFIFGSDTEPAKLDRNFWFSDSPVTQQEREYLSVIKEHYPNQGDVIEMEVRTWRGTELTDFQYGLLQSFQALGSGIETVVDSFGQTNENIDNLISGAAAAVQEAATCAATVLAVGDFGDFYELVSGYSICGGDPLSTEERLFSGLGLIVGNGTFWRGAARAAGLLPGAKVVAGFAADVAEKARRIGLSQKELEEFSDDINLEFLCKK